MRLQEYVETLEKMPNLPVIFNDDRKAGPLCTWRGDYSKLTIPSSIAAHTAKELVADAKEIMAGKVMIGYKGGDFIMDERTAVYADEYGECDHNIPTRIYWDMEVVVIDTTAMPEYSVWG